MTTKTKQKTKMVFKAKNNSRAVFFLAIPWVWLIFKVLLTFKACL